MARPRGFSEADVLERAMQFFWTNGYEATSMSVLTAHLGVHPGSLYRTFADKHTLFLRALEHYRDTHTRRLAPTLLSGGPIVPRIREVLIDYLQAAADEDVPRGCIAVNTVGERLPHDEAAARIIREILSLVEDGFRQGLQAAARRGEIPGDTDVATEAMMLMTLLQGLQVVVKADRDPLRLSPVIDAALQRLTGKTAVRAG
ncbi:TetR/AcrR family transcriptional regulator [Actinoplanes sp. TBRC 11911]|uniref:TetR/AcrR family transcriptional regulator n=1 Tax=Actinoplanes sp. TBRC 11911 TaxID=2729386 RepID=UPI00145F28DF|nr:TetR/AcrR family transcriptional regulator [Actinoplanes sp. TBRC 11911]NMO49806.1 TetR/AcrR family transcriptional regulator [Actinoplanes sp. TBRC 11911]